MGAFETVLNDADAETLHSSATFELGKLCEATGDAAGAEANYRRLAAMADPTWTPIGQAMLGAFL